MYCEICHKKIRVKKQLYNLFRIETHHICEYCLMNYPLIVNHQIIPTDLSQINWYSLIHEDDDINGIAYMSFLKPFYLDFIRQKDNSIYLYFDHISDKLMIILQSLEFGQIYLVTLYDNINENEKEHTYVI